MTRKEYAEAHPEYQCNGCTCYQNKLCTFIEESETITYLRDDVTGEEYFPSGKPDEDLFRRYIPVPINPGDPAPHILITWDTDELPCASCPNFQFCGAMQDEIESEE